MTAAPRRALRTSLARALLEPNSGQARAGSSGPSLSGVRDAEHPHVFRCSPSPVAPHLPRALPTDTATRANRRQR